MVSKVGFVGLGAMGRPMVENLASGAGLEVWAHDQSPAVATALQAHPAWGVGLQWADGLPGLAGCEVVITMLPNSRITNAVVEGAGGRPGLLDLLTPGTVVVDMGSSHPIESQRLAQCLAQRGIGFVDAPVSGAVVKARSGQLAIMVGGDDATVAQVQPLLDRMGSTFIRTGAVGSAHAMKALNNYVYAAGLLAVSEALLMAQTMGLDTDRLAEVLNASSGRNVAAETKLRQFMIPRTFNGGFALSLMAKDLDTAAQLQSAVGLAMPQLSLCHRLWQDALQQLPERVDNTEILRFLEVAQVPVAAA